MSHVMIDVKSLGKSPSGIVVSVGAIIFDLDYPPAKTEEGKKFYFVCDPSQDRTIDRDIVLGLLKEGDFIKAMFLESPMGTISDCVAKLTEFIESNAVTSVWDDGVSGSVATVENVCRAQGMRIPWTDDNKASMKALLHLESSTKESFIKWLDRLATLQLGNNALNDATEKAQYVYDFLQYIKSTL